MNPGTSLVSGPLAEPLRTHARADTWFRLRSPEAIPDQVRDLLLRELELAAEGLWVSPGPALDAGVLYARSAVDKVRLLLALLRTGLEKDLRRSADRRLAAVRAGLEEARDVGTLEDVVERLRQATREPALRDALMVLGGRLAERRYRESATRRSSEALGELRGELERLHADAHGWTPLGDGFDLLAPGLSRVHRRARKGLDRLRKGGKALGRHRRWMGRMRDLGYTFRLVEPVWSAPVSALGHEVDRVTGRLREAGELDRLMGLLAAHEPLGANLPVADLGERLDRLGDRFRAEARSVGRRLLADPPGVFRARMETWWLAWSEETGSPAGS
jgi:hypothetical protein